MKAVVFSEFGAPDVLHLQEMEKPAPKEHEILIRIRATSVNFGDVLARDFSRISPRDFSMPMPLWLPSRLAIGIRKPRKHVLGSEFAGDVEAVGAAVSRFTAGDKVFGYRGMSFGANAEYLCMSEDGIVDLMPACMSYEEAAAVPYGALMGLSLLQKAGVQPGQKVLINGASGGIGASLVQLAKHAGAEVTAVCGTPRLGLVKALGADHVIDYTAEDFTRRSETWDVIFDIPGKSTFARCKGSLTANGCYFPVSFKMKDVFQMLWTARRGGKKVVCALLAETPEHLATIRDLIERGAYRSIIDRRFPLEQAADAHHYVEGGQKKGHVVLTMAQPLPQSLNTPVYASAAR